MFRELKDMINRSSDHLLQDFAGAAALVLMLLVGLHLVPGLS